MANFCTKCGRPLNENAKCDFCSRPGASTKAFFIKLFDHMGMGVPTANFVNASERGRQIVPDLIKPNDGEVAIKQYEVATLRSRIRGQWAKGKLQVTNKRLLFHAGGMSYKGSIAQQYEFSIAEIAGIEIKKSNRISALNILLSIVLTLIVASPFYSIFNSINESFAVGGAILGYLCMVAFVAPFFVVRKRFWLKLCFMAAALGTAAGLSDLTSKVTNYILGGKLFDITDTIAGILVFVWLFNVVLVSLVPDLVLTVKTKGASEAFVIRRKQHATPFKQELEYTGFSEVLPDKVVDLMASEIGALIDDVQTFGDNAIEKWKE
ncbi:MAG: hypothetical protein IJC33_06620 [Clostridia bacterium]|nr:hypothetical protein [Clostridia bacterium]